MRIFASTAIPPRFKASPSLSASIPERRGRRPTAVSTASASSTPAEVQTRSGAQASCVFSTLSTRDEQTNFIPRASSPRRTLDAASGSSPVRISGSASITVTCEPNERYAEPSSRPITPPPITTSRRGSLPPEVSALGVSAEVLSWQSSAPGNGGQKGDEPVAIIMSDARYSPSPSLTRSPSCSSARRLITSTPAERSIPSTPPRSRSVTASLPRTIARIEYSPAPRRIPSPVSARMRSRAAALSSRYLVGMHPTLRQVPPRRSASNRHTRLPARASAQAAV